MNLLRLRSVQRDIGNVLDLVYSLQLMLDTRDKFIHDVETMTDH